MLAPMRASHPLRRGALLVLPAAVLLASASCLNAGRRLGGEMSEGRARWVAERVARMRGIPLDGPLSVEVSAREDLAKQYGEKAKSNLDEAGIAKRIRADRALGLLPEGLAIRGQLFAVGDLGFAGTYDAETKAIVVVNDLEGGLRTDNTLAHEVAHRLDDSRWSLQALCLAAEGNTDRALATLALIEGSAVVTQLDFALSESYDDAQGGLGGIVAARTIDDLESDIGLMARVRGERARAILRTTPSYLRERIVFPYTRGLAFVRALRERRGTASVDQAFVDPPLSTEQILHPAKLVDRRDDPVTVTVGIGFTGGTLVHEDTLGEFGIRQLLETRLPRRRARAAAAGWGGDRYAVVEVGGADVLLWRTEWDDEREAEEFARAADDWLAARHGVTPFWMVQFGRDDMDRPDGRIARIRRTGRTVLVVDGIPAGAEEADADWALRLADASRIEMPARPRAPQGGLDAGVLSSRDYDDGSGAYLLGGLAAASERHGEASSFSLLGGLLLDVDRNADGTRISALMGLLSWRTAPRQELKRLRVGSAVWGEDHESHSWSILPIVDAPAASSAPGGSRVRTGLVNWQEVREVAFERDGTVRDGDPVQGETSVLLGLLGRSWTDAPEPDGTPFERSTWWGPFPIGFSFSSTRHGPLGARYQLPPPESSPEAAAAAEASAKLPGGGPHPGDVEEVVSWNSLGQLVASYESRQVRRGDGLLVDLRRWSLLSGLLAMGWSRGEHGMWTTPIVGWANVPEGEFLLLLFGLVPIPMGSAEPAASAAPAPAAATTPAAPESRPR